MTPSIFFILLIYITTINSSTSPQRFSNPYPSSTPSQLLLSSPPSTSSHLPKTLVPVSLGVMSKCPDAQICEDVFDRVLTQSSSKIQLTMVYMGDLDDDQEFGIRCRHGNLECQANIQQLCYRQLHPLLRHWWSFIQCQNYAGLSRVGNTELARSCTILAGHNWEEVEDCVKGDQGRSLLRSSVLESHALPVLKSCSIFINRRMVCMHDSSWKQCPSGHEPIDLIHLIDLEYERINS